MIGTMLLAFSLAGTAQQASSVPTIDLFCQGRGDRYDDGGDTARFPTAVRIRTKDGAIEVLIPDNMLADDDARGWRSISKLAVSSEEISGKIKFSWLFSPVMQLDRGDNSLSISGSLANFAGTCRRFDPQTSRMPSALSARTTATARPASIGGLAAGRPTTASGIRSDWARPSVRSQAVTARQPGSFVLARYKNGANLYPAQVIRVTGNLITLQYGSGTQESVPSSLVSDLNWKVGSYLECKLVAGTFEPVTITGMGQGYSISAVTDDGRTVRSSMQSCRSVARR